MEKPIRLEIYNKKLYFTFWSRHKQWHNPIAKDKLWHSMEQWQIAIGKDDYPFKIYTKHDWFYENNLVRGFSIFGIAFLYLYFYESEELK